MAQEYTKSSVKPDNGFANWIACPVRHTMAPRVEAARNDGPQQLPLRGPSQPAFGWLGCWSLEPAVYSLFLFLT